MNSFPEQPSLFSDSPFGEHWDFEAQTVEASTQINLDFKSNCENNNSIFFRYSEEKLTRLIKDIIPSGAKVASFILLKAESGVKPLGGSLSKSTKLIDFNGFDATKMESLVGARMGPDLLLQNLDAKTLECMIKNHLQWVYEDDGVAQLEYFDEYYDQLREQHSKYNKNRHDLIMLVLRMMQEQAIAAFSDFLGVLLEKIANEIRELKITEENAWNPFQVDGITPNEKFEPTFVPNLAKIEIENLEDYFHQIDDIVIHLLNRSKNYKAVDVIQLHAVATYLYKQVKLFLKGIFLGITTIWKVFSSAINHYNAFMVGIYNGVLELGAGIIEVLSLVLKLTDPKNMDKFVKDIQNAIDQFKKIGFWSMIGKIFNAFIQKYKDAPNSYLILRYLGEDIAELVIEILLAIFTGGAVIFKKLIKKLDDLLEVLLNPKKGMDDLLDQVDEAADLIQKQKIIETQKWTDFNAEDLDWMHRKQNTGNLGGKILSTKQIKTFRKLLKEKYDIDLIFEGAKVTNKIKFKPVGKFKTPKQLFEFMAKSKPPKVGVFDSKTKQMLLPKNSTEIVAFHELAHVKHLKSMGNDAYKRISKLDREMNVWEQIYKSKDRWTKDELEDALDYINRERKKVDLPLLNIEL